MTEIHGIIAYPITPFTADGDAVDTDTLAAVVEQLVTTGAHAIAPLGSTGESAYLTEAEFDAVVDTTVGTVNGRVPVIVGASDLTTANTIRRARYAQQAGADAVMVLPISYWKLGEREIVQHYASNLGCSGPADHGLQQPRHQWHRHGPRTAGADVQ